MHGPTESFMSVITLRERCCRSVTTLRERCCRSVIAERELLQECYSVELLQECYSLERDAAGVL